MFANLNKHSLTHWRADVLASLTVFLVALPLCMGVAIASGAPVGMGLISGAAGGIVAALLGGAPFVVSGPTTSLTTLVFSIVQTHGVAAIGLATMMAGLLQVFLSTAKVARLAAAIPPAVMRGMLAGLGLIIAISQLPLLLGSTPAGSVIENLRALPGLVHAATMPAWLLAAVAMGIMLVWPKLPCGKAIPASLVAIGSASLLAFWQRWPLAKVSLPAHLWQLHLPHLSVHSLLELAGVSLSIALVASSEAILCAVAMQPLAPRARVNLDRELLAQGLANVVCGFLGGLPIAGVIVRSSANHGAGGKTRAAAALHGVWILVAASLCAPLLRHVPLSALAAVLCVAGIKLLRPQDVIELRRQGTLLSYVAAFIGTVSSNLLVGIGAGVLAHLGLLGWRVARGEVRVRLVIEPTAPLARVTGEISAPSI